jgi:hypothetical protein
MQLGWFAGDGASTGSVPGASMSQVCGFGRKARAISTAADVTEGGARVAWVLAEGAGTGTVVPANAGQANDNDRRAIADIAFTRKLPDTVS